MPKKSKEPTAPEDPEHEEELGEDDATGKPSKAGKSEKKKKKKRKAEREPEVEPEAEEQEGVEDQQDEGDDDDDGNEEHKDSKQTLKNRKRRSRSIRFRNVAKKLGYSSNGGPIAASGADAAFFAITQADVKRLMASVPHDFSKGSYSKSETEARIALSEESLPASVLRVAQSRIEPLLRNIVNEATLRMIETSSRQSLDAATVLSVIRPYTSSMMFTAVQPPKGLIKYAQKEGVLGATEADREAADDDDTESKDIAKFAKKIAKKKAEEKTARKERLAKLKGEREAKAVEAAA